MGTVLERKPTASDTAEYVLKAIIALAKDKRCRVMLKDDNEWKEQKLKEIARLGAILKKKL